MKVVVIGGTGHIGSYLIPKLVISGHEVIWVSRRNRVFREHPTWQYVEHLEIDRTVEEKAGSFGKKIRRLKGEAVMDLICFSTRSVQMMVDALSDRVGRFIHCGTMWVHGHSEELPTRESQKRKPFGSYGIQKAAIESELLEAYRRNAFPATILHPGHITGPGKMPIGPAGNLNPEIFLKLALGQEIALPNLGMETLHHVHVADVAQAFVLSLENPGRAMGESFHIVSEQAITLRYYATAVAQWFGNEADLAFQSWDQWRKDVSNEDSRLTWDHIAHSPNGSIEKAKRLLNFKPKYSSLQAIKEAIGHYAKTENIEALQFMEK